MDLANELFSCTSVDEVRRVLRENCIDPDPIDTAPFEVEFEPPKPTYHVPGPYEIALQLGCALAGTGRYETPGAALQAAWMAVPEFYQGRDTYLRDIVPMFYGVSHAAADQESV